MIPRIKQSIGLLMSRSDGPGATLAVSWNLYSGTLPDDVTGAQEGGITTLMSGTLRCFSVEEGVRTVARKFQEIQEGDLIVDIPADGLVSLWSGGEVSGTIPLQGLDGVRFERPPGSGQFYVQAGVGEELADAWRTIAGDTELFRTILLRRST